jgi:hypothetical protein
MAGQKITRRQKDISRLLREKNIIRLSGLKKIMCFRQRRAANKRSAIGDSVAKVRMNYFVKRYFFSKCG